MKQTPHRSTGGGRPGTAIRTQIVLMILALTALALAISGGLTFILASSATDARIDQDLTEEADHLHRMVTERVNPTTGEAFRTPSDVVIAAIQLKAPSPNEGVLGLRADGTPLVSRQIVALHPQDDLDLLQELTPMVGGDTMLRSIRTPNTDYRVLVVPVTAAEVGASAETVAFVLAVDRAAEQRQTAHAFQVYAVVATIAVALIAIIGWALTGKLLRPIRAISRVARATEGADLTARIPVVGDNDLSELSRAFNAMLNRLETAFESQRQLLDDVGHELRTPLTIVRGNLEVMDPADPVDTEASRAIALAELDRMNRLVEDLTTLAISTRPDFIRTAPCDIGKLTHDVMDMVGTLGDRLWTLSGQADGVVDVDPQRLTQAWLQLAANAVKFSDPGSSIGIGSDLADDGGGYQLRLWVRDDGTGIEADDLTRIFDRFGRAAGTRDRDGSGLGLAIVQAIARGHGGDVVVTSTPGIGSTFTIRLPVHLSSNPQQVNMTSSRIPS